jgi:2-polyprenyl-3-methyl-5-hydroxy-6-metoxy-1,4-benzoquinol methylase
LSPEKEKARYLTHRNEAGQEGYVAFLTPMVEELLTRVSAGAEGLDFGSGPGPVLAELLRRAGCAMQVYDPYFSPEVSVLDQRYDFVTCTETVEHFHEPGREFARLAALLKPGGWLAVMTRLLGEGEDFPGWWYRNDATHVCFYAEETLSWIAKRHGWRLERPRPTVAFFKG